MLQMFHLDVSKVDLRMFQEFHLFQMYFANISSECFKIDLVLHMLLLLYTHVFMRTCKCFICFSRMLQVFHFDVSKVDLGEAHIAAASAPPWVSVLSWVTACACLVFAVVCTQACETEQDQVVLAHVWARVASRAGWVQGNGAACVRCGHGCTVRR
jgi:hypothetical protein